MSKSVLISINPEWCDLIIRGKKTLEVRKTRPKLETPFTTYIYCTKAPQHLITIFKDGEETMDGEIHHGKPVFIKCDKYLPDSIRDKTQMVIGEFVCDEVYKVDRDSVGFNFTATSMDLPIYTMPENNDEYRNVQQEKLTTCLTEEQLSKYLGIRPGWGWHISNLKIYDRPLDLRELTGLQKTRFGMRPVEITSPPQSWRYVEELHT